MWTPLSKYTIVKPEVTNGVYKIQKVDSQQDNLAMAQKNMEKVSILTSSSITATIAIRSESTRKIASDRRSASFTGNADVKCKPSPSPPHRRHSTNSNATIRSRSPIQEKGSLDTDKRSHTARITDPKPLPQWITEKEARKERDRANEDRFAVKRETGRRQRFVRDNSLGYEPRRHNRHRHQSERQEEYEAYFNGHGRTYYGSD